MTNTRISSAAAATAVNAGYVRLFTVLTGSSGCQRALLSTVAMERGSVAMGSHRGAALSVVVVVDSCGVAIIRSIGPSESSLAQCGLKIHLGYKTCGFVFGGPVNG